MSPALLARCLHAPHLPQESQDLLLLTACCWLPLDTGLRVRLAELLERGGSRP